jgi:hypothetical protein
MNLVSLPYRLIETVDRRVLGAFQFVDAATQLPLAVPAAVEVRGATLADAPVDAALREHAVRILQNRSGLFVILRAPFFDTYAGALDNPPLPPETVVDPLCLRLAVTDPGPQYLPQEFQYDLPRALDPDASDSVFEPVRVGLFRSPGAPAQDGWVRLRVRVTEAGVDPPNPLPGVLIRVFRSPRGVGDLPIGAGMTDWRGSIRGEALVPVIGIQRFRPGSGASVVETDQPIEFEATRHSGFTGAAGQLPDVLSLVTGTGAGLIRPPAQPLNSLLEIVRPATPPPIRVQAGREYVVHLAMP